MNIITIEKPVFMEVRQYDKTGGVVPGYICFLGETRYDGISQYITTWEPLPMDFHNYLAGSRNEMAAAVMRYVTDLYKSSAGNLVVKGNNRNQTNYHKIGIIPTAILEDETEAYFYIMSRFNERVHEGYMKTRNNLKILVDKGSGYEVEDMCSGIAMAEKMKEYWRKGIKHEPTLSNIYAWQTHPASEGWFKTPVDHYFVIRQEEKGYFCSSYALTRKEALFSRTLLCAQKFATEEEALNYALYVDNMEEGFSIEEIQEKTMLERITDDFESLDKCIGALAKNVFRESVPYPVYMESWV